MSNKRFMFSLGLYVVATMVLLSGFAAVGLSPTRGWNAPIPSWGDLAAMWVCLLWAIGGLGVSFLAVDYLVSK